eukprot:8615474-Lingulodinium_polyedra.AAC.1
MGLEQREVAFLYEFAAAGSPAAAPVLGRFGRPFAGRGHQPPPARRRGPLRGLRAVAAGGGEARGALHR